MDFETVLENKKVNVNKSLMHYVGMKKEPTMNDFDKHLQFCRAILNDEQDGNSTVQNHIVHCYQVPLIGTILCTTQLKTLKLLLSNSSINLD